MILIYSTVITLACFLLGALLGNFIVDKLRKL
jgi:hypothetical protein